MKNRLAMAALAALVSGPLVMPPPAFAAERTYHKPTRHYHRRCGGGNGAVGTIVGGVGGAVIGKAIVGGPVGLVAGGVGGALLGGISTRRIRGIATAADAAAEGGDVIARGVAHPATAQGSMRSRS